MIARDPFPFLRPLLIGCLILTGLVAVLTHANAQTPTSLPGSTTPLDNSGIVKLVKAGLTEDLIVGLINSQPGAYSLGADDVLKLKDQKVPDKVILAMLSKAPSNPQKAIQLTATPPPQPSQRSSDGPLELGVYARRSSGLRELKPEVVNWKTGGVVKAVATAGIVKGDINGRINHPYSPNQLTLPAELVVYVPEGVAITEYQLIRLHEHSDAREFRTVTGGILHVSGGSMRDEIHFEGIKTAPRTYSIKLDALPEGEYGLLPPGLESSSRASSTLGKMYTFTVVR